MAQVNHNVCRHCGDGPAMRIATEIEYDRGRRTERAVERCRACKSEWRRLVSDSEPIPFPSVTPTSSPERGSPALAPVVAHIEALADRLGVPRESLKRHEPDLRTCATCLRPHEGATCPRCSRPAINERVDRAPVATSEPYGAGAGFVTAAALARLAWVLS